MKDQTIEAAQQAAATKANIALGTTITTGTAGASGFIEENYQIMMLVIAAAGFMVSFYYSWRNFSLNKKRLAVAEDKAKEELRNQIIAEMNGDLPEVARNKIKTIKDRRK